jgi:hypothetical protein
MNCWHCNNELTWGGDHDIDHNYYVMETNLTCQACDTLVLVYLPKEEDDTSKDNT